MTSVTTGGGDVGADPPGNHGANHTHGDKDTAGQEDNHERIHGNHGHEHSHSHNHDGDSHGHGHNDHSHGHTSRSHDHGHSHSHGHGHSHDTHAHTHGDPSHSPDEKVAVVVNPHGLYHAHFDCFSGAAGDMMLASCLDTARGNNDELFGKITGALQQGLSEMKGEFELSRETVWKGGMGSIAATKVNVSSIYGHAAAPVPKEEGNRDQDNSTSFHEETSESSQVRSDGGDKTPPIPSPTHKHHDDHSHDKTTSQTHDHHQEESHGQHHDHSHDHHHAHDDHHHEHSHDHAHPHTHSHDHSHSHSHGHSHSHSHGHSHSHDHSHPHTHSHPHPHSHSHSHTHTDEHDHSEHSSKGPLRNLPEIQRMLETSSAQEFIPLSVRKLAVEAFTELAIAESFTHGTSSTSTVHFHEVGAIDSIVDVVGTLLALYFLQVRTVSCSALPMGEGSVWTMHGQLPVPAFATMRLLMGMKTCGGPGGNTGVVTGELVTPTAAALLRVLTGVARSAGLDHHTGRAPNFTPRAVGVGAGTKEFVKHPNVMRVILGDDVVWQHDPKKKKMLVPNREETKGVPKLSRSEKDTSKLTVVVPTSTPTPAPTNMRASETVTKETPATVAETRGESLEEPPWLVEKLTLLEANLDDATPELLGHVVEKLINMGALDVWVQPIVMKKSRSAHLLKCLCRDHQVQELMLVLFRESTTLGIRLDRNVERAALHRRIVTVATPFSKSTVNVKVGMLRQGDEQEIVSVKPEYDHCRAIAESTGIALKKVTEAALQEARNELSRSC